MIEVLKEMILSDTGRDSSIIFIGTLINILAGGLFFIIAPRLLGPGDYGLFSVILSTGILANNISNFGIDTGILKFAKKNDEFFNKTLSIAFKSYIALGLLIGITGFFISPLVSSLLGQRDISNLLRIAFGADVFLLLTNFYVAALQAKGEFKKSSIVIFSSNVVRLAVLVIAYRFLTVGLYFMTLLFFGITAVSVIFGAIFTPFKFQKANKEEYKRFFKYNFWIALSLIIPSIPLDNYFLLKISGPIAAGLYAAPFKILTFVYQFGGNFSRVLAPRFASFDTHEKTINYAKKSAPIVALLIFGLIVLIFISRPLISFLFGTSYLQSVAVMQVLAVGFIFFIATIIPSSIILYYLGDSKTSFGITLLQTLAFLVLLVLFVPQNGSLGAAAAFSISQFLTFSSSTLFVFYNLKKK